MSALISYDKIKYSKKFPTPNYYLAPLFGLIVTSHCRLKKIKMGRDIYQEADGR